MRAAARCAVLASVALMALVNAGGASAGAHGHALMRVQWMKSSAAPGTPARFDRVGVLKIGSPAARNVLVFEPGTSSHHREPAHSLSMTAYGTTVVFQQTHAIQNQLHLAALQCFQTAQLSQNGLQQIVCGTFGLLLHFAVGALPAIPASYASHVLLDSATPRGVPVLFRGF